MSLSRAEIIDQIKELHCDSLDIEVTHSGGGFTVAPIRSGPYVSDIGSSYEVPDYADEHGRVRFTAGGFDVYQYHASYVVPRPGNYEPVLDDLESGDITKAVFGVTAVPEGTWVFGVRTEG